MMDCSGCRRLQQQPFVQIRRDLLAEAEPSLKGIGELRTADADRPRHLFLAHVPEALRLKSSTADGLGHDAPLARVVAPFGTGGLEVADEVARVTPATTRKPRRMGRTGRDIDRTGTGRRPVSADALSRTTLPRWTRRRLVGQRETGGVGCRRSTTYCRRNCLTKAIFNFGSCRRNCLTSLEPIPLRAGHSGLFPGLEFRFRRFLRRSARGGPLGGLIRSVGCLSISRALPLAPIYRADGPDTQSGPLCVGHPQQVREGISTQK